MQNNIANIQTRLTAVRADFPILQRKIGDKTLAYLDSAATSQKPEAVLRAMDDYYRQHNANVHRGVHTLSEEATALYEGTRTKIARFIHAANERQIVFTRGTTEGINLVANTWGRANLRPGDEVLITEMEHHSNIVPWQILQQQINFTLRYLPINDEGTLVLDQLDNLLTEQTKLVSFVHASNVLGTINPVAELTAKAHRVGARVLVDAAQSVPHMPVDVQALDVDFLVFSSHKLCGPTGAGVLYGKRELLEAMPPFLGGGDMIREVKLTGSKWNSVPHKFEAGTPSIAEVIGMGAAIDYLSDIGMAWVREHEQSITRYAYDQLSRVEGLHILGPGPAQRGGLIAFTFNEIHPHDLSAVLDSEGIAIRAGHHCAQPVHDHYNIVASARASFYLYTTQDEIDRLVAGLDKATAVFAA